MDPNPNPNPTDPDPNPNNNPGPNDPTIIDGPVGPVEPTNNAIEVTGSAAPSSEPGVAPETIGISVGSAVGGLCIIVAVVFVVLRCRKSSGGSTEAEIDPETGRKTPKDKRPSLAMLMNQTT